MKRQEKNPPTNPGDLLNQALASVRSDMPDHETMSAAGDRVWQHLSREVANAPQVEAIRGCADVKKLLLQYRGGQLAPARALLVESHLQECVACRNEAKTDNH